MTTAPATIEDSSPAERGFIVVVALWLLAALAAFAVVASAYMAQSAVALATFDDATQLQMLSSGGIELAAYQLSASATGRRPTRGNFSFGLAHSRVTVEYESEAARVNLNMAPRAMIAGLFTALGAQPEDASQFADRVVAWRGGLKPNAQEEENALYRGAGLNYLPRSAPFSNVDELVLVLGLPTALAGVTVFHGVQR